MLIKNKNTLQLHKHFGLLCHVLPLCFFKILRSGVRLQPVQPVSPGEHQRAQFCPDVHRPRGEQGSVSGHKTLVLIRVFFFPAHNNTTSVSSRHPPAGLYLDGLYRVSGNLAVIQKLRFAVNHGEFRLFLPPGTSIRGWFCGGFCPRRSD